MSRSNRAEPATASAGHGVRARARALTLVGVLTAVVLLLTASGQIYDANHYALTEATAILAGDHPYVDFFEVGVPLAAYSAAAAQVLSGHRLLGEFLRQWAFIVAGVVLAFHLGLRLSRRVDLTLTTLPVTLLVLANTPTYHYSKLFFFPLTTVVAWRYIDRPGVLNAVLMALTAAIAFLFRHDYGIYLGFASIVAFVLARASVPASRTMRAMGIEAGAYAACVLIVLAPWAVMVQRNEGLLEYTRVRAGLYQEPPAVPHLDLLRLNPLRQFRAAPPPPPKAATVTFLWQNEVDPATRARLESEHGLRRLDGPDADGRWRYEVANVYDVRLLRLPPYINDTTGFEWDRLRQLNSGFPTADNVVLWLEQMTLFVPLALLVGSWVEGRRSLRQGGAVPPHAWRMAFIAIFLAAVDLALIRQPSYFVTVAPLTAAASGWFLTSRRAWIRATVLGAVALTTFAAFAWVRGTSLFLSPFESVDSTRRTLARMTASPPDYGYGPFEYVRECTAPGDRVLVTGVAPLHVSYYTGRPIAGGHINWHRAWRSDPPHEAQSLALLQRQSVPFVLSTSDPVMTDFRPYPRIHELLATHYRELPGSRGLILVDTRRQPTGRFGPDQLPCFAPKP